MIFHFLFFAEHSSWTASSLYKASPTAQFPTGSYSSLMQCPEVLITLTGDILSSFKELGCQQWEKNTHRSFCTGKPPWSLGEFSAAHHGSRAKLLQVTKMFFICFIETVLVTLLNFRKMWQCQLCSCVVRYIAISNMYMRYWWAFSRKLSLVAYKHIYWQQIRGAIK